MKVQIILLATVAYCLVLSPVIKAAEIIKQVQKETRDFEKIIHFLGYRNIPGNNIGDEHTMESIEKCAQHMIDEGYKLAVWFMEGSKCQLKSVTDGNEILCACGSHVGNYTIDSHTFKSKKITSSNQSGDDIIGKWLDEGICDMFEKTETAYNCKKFDYDLDAIMMFKRED